MSGMQRRVPCTLGACLLMVVGAASAAAEFVAGVFSPPRAAPDFTLEGSHGAALRLRDYLGKAVVLGFGFTSCPNVCPVTLAILAQARKRLGALADEVQVVYVTVDPARDDAARMHAYLAGFDPSFVGGTGSATQLAAVRETYGVIAEKQAVGDDYTFGHSSFTYLIDRAGRLRALMPYGHTADDYAHDLAILLGE